MNFVILVSSSIWWLLIIVLAVISLQKRKTEKHNERKQGFSNAPAVMKWNMKQKQKNTQVSQIRYDKAQLAIYRWSNQSTIYTAIALNVHLNVLEHGHTVVVAVVFGIVRPAVWVRIGLRTRTSILILSCISVVGIISIVSSQCHCSGAKRIRQLVRIWIL